ncbi:poly(ADP-ribose) glycohydrolase isoform X2 [Gymnodraco acuticeps]|uniref:poly(ADP-ribose) glycohydrolase n=1 Tax=Gymnodraco acuticeps TaxID=8218 RepID=A0A6P8UVI0_GYMAC|nr:poly(ADP-ribose) glycohydrolase isoform X2 [Gymnodraco acuticeps]
MAEGQSSNSSMKILKPDVLHNGKKNSDVADGGEISKRSREMTEGFQTGELHKSKEMLEDFRNNSEQVKQCFQSAINPDGKASSVQAGRSSPGPPYPAPSSTGPSYPGPSYPAPSSTGPSYSGPSYSAPSSTGPSYSGPSYPAPSSTGPSYSGPSYSAPSSTGPSYSGPSYPAPSSTGPSYSGPSYPAPSSTGPSYSGPSYSAPSSTGPSYSGPSYPAPSSTGPSYSGPSYPAPSSTGPSYSGPSYPAPSSTGPSSPGPPYPAPSSTGPSYPGPSYPGHSSTGPSYPGPSYPGHSSTGPSYPGRSYPGHSSTGPFSPGPSSSGPSSSVPSSPGPSSSGPSSSVPSSSGPSSSGPSSSVPSSSGPSSSVPSSSEPSSSPDVVSATHVERAEAVRKKREDGPSSCYLLKDMKIIPQCDIKLGHLHFSKTHTVLVDVDIFNGGAGLIPQDGRDVWHNDFVKMPYSQSSHMKTGYTKQNNTVRWEVIYKQLRSLSKKTTASVKDLEDAIIKYNPKYKGQWSFDALSSLVKANPNGDNYSPKLFQKIAELALRLPELVKKAIPLLKRGHTAAITLSQTQIACLLANAFFCTYPHRNFSGPKAEYHNYPSINFTRLFGNSSFRKKQKLRAIMHYFQQVTAKEQTGLVTFERRCLRDTELPNWKNCNKKMHKLHVASHGTIENEGKGMLQVDFASSWIGGGVLGSGLVQEEILFIINPELIVSRLFTEKLGDKECLIVTGSQQFSNYSGFGDTFQWKDPHEERLNRDQWARLQRQIVAIDALHFKHRSEQYNMIDVTRELNKAYCGFMGHRTHEPDIATGNWGCGAFNGDKQLKAVIQLMAAAQAKRGLAFFTFEDESLKQGLQQTYHLLVTERITVDKLYILLEDYCATPQAYGSEHVDLFELIRINFSPRSLLWD